MVTEGFGVLKREVLVKEIEKRYDHPLAEIVQIANNQKTVFFTKKVPILSISLVFSAKHPHRSALSCLCGGRQRDES